MFSQRPRLLSRCVAALLLATPQIAAAQFETRATLPLPGTAPFAAAVGDFNHDGKLDLAVTDFHNGQVIILLGNGDGTFRKGTTYTVGQEASDIVAADFRKNGLLDLVVASDYDSYVYVLLGNGDGTFQDPVAYPASGVGPGLALGDFTGVGNLDIAALTGSQACECISVFPGNGDGTFQPAVTTPVEYSLAAFGLAPGVFTSGGKLDLAVVGPLGSTGLAEVMLGNGDGTFSFDGSYEVSYTPVSAAVADLNGDKKADLVVGNYEGSSVSVLLGRGDGTFQEPVNYSASFPPSVAVHDLNGDDIPDIAAASYLFAPGLNVLLGNGDGTFRPATFYPAGRGPNYVVVGDFNGDQRPDLVLVDLIGGGVITLLNTGAVAFSPTTPLGFKKQTVGTTSAPQTVTLTNTGTTALTISSMKVSSQFGMTNTCGTSVAAGANCAISVTFSPTSTGTKSGTVTIHDSASSKPMVIELSGIGAN